MQLITDRLRKYKCTKELYSIYSQEENIVKMSIVLKFFKTYCHMHGWVDDNQTKLPFPMNEISMEKLKEER
jgi:hypothetical protein